VKRELVEQAAGGDAEAFAVLAREASPQLYGIALRILRDADRAEDALQAALIDIWNDLATLRDPERFDAWGCRIVVRAAYREARRERHVAVGVRRIPVHEVVPDLAADVALHDQLERAFRRLTPEHRAALVLHYVEGLPATSIADALGVPVGTATSRIHYAARQLRAAIEADERSVGVTERAV
jgi:RNA polymerase sigma-70 factor (ECF subfamily)